MISQNKIKFIRSLANKKYRLQNNSFIVEGEKMVLELLESNFETTEIFALPSFINAFASKIDKITHVNEITEQELKKVSSLKTPNQVLAIVKSPNNRLNNNNYNLLSLALDNIQDPGNFGTIIRTANWFGVKNIFCSHDTVDAYNPKVIQSTMGAIFRTNIIYADLKDIIEKATKNGLNIYGAVLDGEDIYESKLNNNSLIILGNESKGISKPIQQLIDNKIRIPGFPKDSNTMESLNVSIANAIILAEFRRQII